MKVWIVTSGSLQGGLEQSGAELRLAGWLTAGAPGPGSAYVSACLPLIGTGLSLRAQRPTGGRFACYLITFLVAEP